MRIWSFTFGCKVNQYETELLRHRLGGASSMHVQKPEDADLLLINSCSVTEFADRECRKMVRKVLRANPTARTIVTGCYATRAPEEVRAISNRVEVYSNQEKDQLPSCVGFEVASAPMGIHQFSGHTRAFLKIQDGCKAPCNYCIIPKVRPDMRSKSVEDVVEEVNALLDHGYQEIVFTGIRLGLYRGESSSRRKPGSRLSTSGQELGPGFRRGDERVDLLGLLKILVAIPKKFRIRLSSLEVTEVTDRLLDFIKTSEKICRHFHIPMQSGNSDVLKAMQRWYNMDFYKERVRAVRSRMPDCGITADVMVGYPTETDEQFEETARNIEEMELSGLHVFRFSARAGTKAALLKPLDPRTVQKRAGILGELDHALRERFYRKYEGTVREVLPEPTGEAWTDNYIRVDVPLSDARTGLSNRRVFSSQLTSKTSSPNVLIGDPQLKKVAV